MVQKEHHTELDVLIGREKHDTELDIKDYSLQFTYRVVVQRSHVTQTTDPVGKTVATVNEMIQTTPEPGVLTNE